MYVAFGHRLLRLPFLPVATIGTAVAFLVGFKNNAAYERFWEGRKIWGGLVNESRSFGAAVRAFLPDKTQAPKRLIYRHLAFINSLRIQLRQKSRFLEGAHRSTARRLQRHDAHLRSNWDAEVPPFLEEGETADLKTRVNPATQLLKLQAEDLSKLQRSGELDLFHQLHLMDLIQEFSTLQGKCERIKNTPFPRQYAEFSRLFTRVFILLVPCGLLSVFDVTRKLSPEELVFTLLPMMFSTTVIAWVFSVMEGVGDASEDPFERSISDVPMNALCRAIERDLRDMLDEKDLPEPEQPIDDILY